MLDQTLDLDEQLFSKEFFANPYALFQVLRAKEPVYWSARHECWLITRYADVLESFRDMRLSNAGRIASALDRLPLAARRSLRPSYEHFASGVVHSDPPDHTRLRRIIGKAFSRETVEAIRPRVAEMVSDLLDQLAGRGEIDLIEDFAFPLPAMVLSELLAIPIEDQHEFKHLCDEILVLTTTKPSAVAAKIAQESLIKLRGGIEDVVHRRRREPGRDLVSRLVVGEDDGIGLSDSEVISTCATLLIAGHETTTNLIANAVLALLDAPAEMEMMRNDPSLDPQAIEEFLRFDSPQLTVPRVAKADIETNGRRIQAGDRVLLAVSAANRDPAQFDDPDQLNLRRSGSRHIGFGHGIHLCLGAPLARIEAQIAIGGLIRRFPDLRLARAEVDWRQDGIIRGPVSLPVTFQ